MSVLFLIALIIVAALILIRSGNITPDDLGCLPVVLLIILIIALLLGHKP